MNRPNIIALPFIILIAISCSTTITSVSDIGLNDKLYDYDFVLTEERNPLEKIVGSVKMINCLAYYESYLFDINSGLVKESVPKVDLKSLSISVFHSTETASGTATIIYNHAGKAALLTCAHILDFPDTLISYYKNNDGSNSKIIESLSIKVKQSNFLPEFTVANEVEILAIDPISDIAIVGKEVSSLQSAKYTPINVSIGSTKELSWGTKVHMVGFPLNYKMITSGIVSPPQSIERDYFLVDAVFNRGFSGGIVLAVRDGAPNFEFVGMVKSGTVHREFILKPNTNISDFVYLPNVPFTGEALVDEKTDIKYGVTKIMSIEKIFEFIDNSKDLFFELGYDPEKFLKISLHVKTGG